MTYRPRSLRSGRPTGAFVKNSVIMNSPAARQIRHATMNAAISNPLLLFKDGYWEDGELRITDETIIWIAAQ